MTAFNIYYNGVVTEIDKYIDSNSHSFHWMMGATYYSQVMDGIILDKTFLLDLVTGMWSLLLGLQTIAL